MKIHILCDSPKQMTGFSIVGKNLAVELRKLGHEISMTGFQTTVGDNERVGYTKVMPLHVQHIDEIGQYIHNVQKINPDICINIFNADDAQQNTFPKIIKPTFWYVPIEGKDISEMMAKDLCEVSKSGKIIAQCDWGKNEMLKVGVESTTIYHGYDPQIFKKINLTKSININEKINILRYKSGKWNEKSEDIKFLNDELDGKFIFGFIGANHGIRKRIERLLTAYSLFLSENKKRKDDTLLVLKTMPISITSPANLIRICAKLKISSNVVFLYGENNKLCDDSINIIYNCFNVNVSASSSEGFGFPTLESMACGIPQIGPNCSSFIELIKDNKGIDDRGLLVEKGEWVMINDGSYRFEVNEQDLAYNMEIIYSNNNIRKEFGKNAEIWSKQYTWKKVSEQWNNLLNTWKRE